jgi:hypothetical protein
MLSSPGPSAQTPGAGAVLQADTSAWPVNKRDLSEFRKFLTQAHTESETVLGLSWVAVVGVPWGDGWTLLHGTFGGLTTQETK